MIDISSVEKTIKTMRSQAAQLEATASALESMIEPWRQTEKMVQNSNQFLQQWMKVWTGDQKP